jgi:hypothetical protein
MSWQGIPYSGRNYHSTTNPIKSNTVIPIVRNLCRQCKVGEASIDLQIIANITRYTVHPNGYHAAVRLSEDYAMRSRTELDIDDPSIDCLQALLLLGVAFTAAGKGKKAYMMLGRSDPRVVWKRAKWT